MAKAQNTILGMASGAARVVAAALIAGFWRKRSLAEVEERLAGLPGRERGLIIGGVILALALCAFLAAQFGWIAMLGFWLAVIVIVN